MTKREQEVLAFIVEYRKANDLSPSVREIGEGVGLHSTSSVQKYIQSLTEKGYLYQTKGKMRTLRLVRVEGNTPSVPGEAISV